MSTFLTRRGRSAMAALGLLVTLETNLSAWEAPGSCPLRDGDRIVLIGDTLIERDQRYGYLEMLLTLEHPMLNLTFRNLGWSGDTVRGLSRAGFDPPEAGRRELEKQILAARPTVLIVGYGMSESFDGPDGLSRFSTGLSGLLDAVASRGVSVVLLAPIAHEDLGRPLPDPSNHNRSLALYSEAVRRLANERGARFIDLYQWTSRAYSSHPESRETTAGKTFTDNGIHLNEHGYELAASAICAGLGCSLASPWKLSLGKDGKVLEVTGARVEKVSASGNGIRFNLTEERLASRSPELRISGLPPGDYSIRIDGKHAARAKSAVWAQGVELTAGPSSDQVARLRKSIQDKNLLFFHRWRPQNMTYLFGFRNYEQGNNAIEVPQFDPLVEAKEREIASLRVPVPHVCELIFEGEVAR